MKRAAFGMSIVGAMLLSFVFLAVDHVRAEPDRHDNDSRVEQGFRISPVHLNLKHRNRELVGEGSYLVNAVASCNDCHTCPSYAPGHDPYGPPFGPPGGGDGKVNAANFLAGGVPFNPPGVISANITPDATTGQPEGHTFREFKSMLRTGHDVDDPAHILQVMPWPVFRNMTDRDIRAIYEYLSAIPHAEPGSCVAPGQ
jgi:hypothetical protein